MASTASFVHRLFWGDDKAGVSVPMTQVASAKSSVVEQRRSVKTQNTVPLPAVMRPFLESLAAAREVRANELRVADRARRASLERQALESARVERIQLAQQAAVIAAAEAAADVSSRLVRMELARQRTGGPWVCSPAVFGHLTDHQ